MKLHPNDCIHQYVRMYTNRHFGAMSNLQVSEYLREAGYMQWATERQSNIGLVVRMAREEFTGLKNENE